MMNKEKLIEKFTEHVKRRTKEDTTGRIIGINTTQAIEFCAEAALTLMSRDWVRVEDELPLPIYSTVGKISKYVPFITLDDKEWFGYYDYIGKVWQAQGFKTFRKDEVKSWFNLPTPPKQ